MRKAQMQMRHIYAVFFALVVGGHPTFAADFAREAIALPLSSLVTLQAEIRKPVQHAAQKLPVILIFGGFEKAGQVLDLVPVTSGKFMLATVDYPFEGERKFRWSKAVDYGWKFKRSIPQMRAAIQALIRHLQTRPDVDQARIAVLGASFGTPFALQAAADNSSLSAVLIVHGFADIRGTIEHRLMQLWEKRWGSLARPLAWAGSFLVTWLIHPPSPEADAKSLRAGQVAVMIEASEDQFIPYASRALLWQSLSESKARVSRRVMPGGHLMPGSSRMIGEIMSILEAELKRLGWF